MASTGYSPRGRPLAVALAGAITLAVGAMVFAKSDSKKDVQSDSMYHPAGAEGTRMTAEGKTDARYDSTSIREKVHELPGKR
ncbi:hypothetical protein CONPUDRAFT_156406 [Coniophora puteana RWD-64-598 SS2]|uniref:Uncharacterized protein n=1 Tax=Coniophora puteana (strain RWD-64-598) TaxID=741705 RepID=A0A5M3MGR0_CONPW|nr:uncharacterized protein CONPUDRAFT_156406 [Coniophora puteana RWD-64-598 SS2]EIW78419.1 hypothetical protein CONPUDRAFT_156406 [Coniophora puteana RWD-64-598 SS2]